MDFVQPGPARARFWSKGGAVAHPEGRKTLLVLRVMFFVFACVAACKGTSAGFCFVFVAFFGLFLRPETGRQLESKRWASPFAGGFRDHFVRSKLVPPFEGIVSVREYCL